MSKEVEFRRELDSLWKRRSDWLRHILSGPRYGKPPKFTKEQREKSIAKLLKVASEGLAPKYAKREFKKRVKYSKKWKNAPSKGRDRHEKKKHFRKWYAKYIGNKHCIYIFWGAKSCLYVGETDRPGGKRIVRHFTKYWFNQTKWIGVYVPRKTYLPSLECLAIHTYSPKYNTNLAPRRKWRSKCPLCRLRKEIESELRLLFPV